MMPARLSESKMMMMFDINLLWHRVCVLATLGRVSSQFRTWQRGVSALPQLFCLVLAIMHPFLALALETIANLNINDVIFVLLILH